MHQRTSAPFSSRRRLMSFPRSTTHSWRAILKRSHLHRSGKLPTWHEHISSISFAQFPAHSIYLNSLSPNTINGQHCNLTIIELLFYIQQFFSRRLRRGRGIDCVHDSEILGRIHTEIPYQTIYFNAVASLMNSTSPLSDQAYIPTP